MKVSGLVAQDDMYDYGFAGSCQGGAAAWPRIPVASLRGLKPRLSDNCSVGASLQLA